MEDIVKNTQTKEESIEKTKVIKEEFTIFGFTITKILAYFIIYSVIGFIIETIFGLITKGVIESRKSFLYGPFCSIYGVGAVIMIISLQRFKKNNYTLFFAGFLIGSIIEYVISLIGEVIFHIKWWDYSDMPFNLNGRICIAFSFFWGILAIYLMKHVNPKVDILLAKFSNRILKKLAIIITIFLFIDFAITGFALKMFFARLVNEYDLQLQNVDSYLEEYTKMYEDEGMKTIVDKFFNDEKMLKTFPNIKVTEKNGDILWVKDVLSDIQPFYYRIFSPKLLK